MQYIKPFTFLTWYQARLGFSLPPRNRFRRRLPPPVVAALGTLNLSS
jgi:hypothetical protein